VSGYPIKAPKRTFRHTIAKECRSSGLHSHTAAHKLGHQLLGDVTTASTGGLLITGTATITLNGNSAPISPSPMKIEISGGSEVEFSNITLTFGFPGYKHLEINLVLRQALEHM
jgi:hypothetical protein